ncbi:MAG: TerC family protein [Myxococcales bacterium]|nr:TerC family protein [Myxococcales bacterium]
MTAVELLSKPETWLSLLTLTALEIVLGIDNIIFLSILVARLPSGQRDKARKIGMVLALFMRLGLLLTLSFIMRLTKPFFTVLSRPISGRDLILLVGGTFLIVKSTQEIYEKLEGDEAGEDGAAARKHAKFLPTIVQIMFLDIVFSLDSVITAVGMAQDVRIMCAAVIAAVLVMLFFAGAVGDFVNEHPSMKILALSFLLLIGVLLVADGMGQHVSKGYVYFAMGFAVMVEMLNLRLRKKSGHVQLRGRRASEPPPTSTPD